jgi:hypothetical protein
LYIPPASYDKSNSTINSVDISSFQRPLCGRAG